LSPRQAKLGLRTVAAAAALVIAGSAHAAALRLSTDPFTNASSQHRTQVEPDSFAFGSTVVAAFQTGRFFDGGASDIGFATSTNGGSSWTSGFLSGLTRYQGAGPYDRASDPSVAFDARHNVWLIESLGLLESPSVGGRAVLVNRSTNGGTAFGGAVTVASGSALDKNWIACDNWPASPFFGNCYAEWDDVGDSQRVKMSVSSDGGLTWGPARNSGDNVTGIGGQPVVQPNGQVVVPLLNAAGTAIQSFRSVDGGASWRATVQIASVTDHPVAGGLRSEPLPSAEVDGAGKVYVVWQDCRFRTSCTANDIVMATTTQAGYPTWSGVTRIPIDATTSGVDHFIPGIGVDPTTSGSTGRVALAYYFYPQAGCTASTCQLDVGLVTSPNGGTSWSAPSQLAGPMSLSWLANTNQGAMVGDYISTSFAGGSPHPVFALANAPNGGAFDEAVYTTGAGQAAPTVTLTSTPPTSTTSTSAHFEWTTTGTVTSTTCQLDTRAPVACTSPQDFTGLSTGGHTFTVTVGNSGGSNSASFSWTITSTPPSVVRLSSDPFTNASSQHRTQVEPDSFAFGSSMVTAFQSGRFAGGGASDIGFATSTNGGSSWTSGFLSGLTKYQGAGPYDRASDPSVAFDARHNVWLIESLGLMESPSVAGKAVVVSRSTNGGLGFGSPVTIATGSFLDKNWITCDNWSASPFFGRCYAQWDDVNDSDRVKMSVSTDGGLTWGAPLNSGDSATGLGGQPVVQANGQVIVPYMAPDGSAIRSFRSVDGGASWRVSVQVSAITDHPVAGGLRSEPLPSAEVDGAGTVYVAWQDCRFRTSCTANDIVMATTTQAGYPTWSGVTRIPIDATTSGVDHFIPGLGVDRTTAGSSARLALAYYFYPQTGCTAATCQLDVGLVSSSDGGSTWSAPSQLAGPMSLSWLASTDQGAMVGDYISTAFTGGVARPVFAVAGPPSGGVFDEAIATR